MSDKKKTKAQLEQELLVMRRRTAELEAYELENARTERLLRRMADISDMTGREYFQAAAEFIASELGTEYAFLGKLDSEKRRVRTIAAFAHGEIIDDIEYELRGSPCDNVMGKQACFYPSGIQERFPDDSLLVSMKAESYVGIPLNAMDGEPLGIIAALACKPMEFSQKDHLISLLQIFSSRVSSEIERIENEEKISKVKTSLNEAQHIAKIGNWDWNILSQELWWSDEIFRIFGLSVHEFTPSYDAFMNRVHPDDRDFVKESVEKALHAEQPYNIDHRIILPDGTEKVVHERAEVSRDESGKPLRMIGTVQDISEVRQMEMQLKKAKQALEIKVDERTEELKSTVELLQAEIMERREVENNLHMSNQFLENILDNTHILVAYLDRDYNFIRVNKAYADADGKEVAFFNGKNHFELYPNDENEKIFRKVLSTAEPYFAFEKPFEYADHPERGITYWDWSLMPVSTHLGEVKGLVLTLVDVTERKSAQIALWESEERFRTLVEQSPVSIQILNAEGEPVQVNRACEKLWGISSDDFKGYNILEDRQLEQLGILSQLNKAFAGEAVLIPATEYDAKKTLGRGNKRWVQTHAYPVTNKEGIITMVVLMHEDFTEHKIAEDRIKASLNEKELLMKEIHHRVKNNMTVVTGLLQLQAANVDDEKYKQVFRNSISRIKSMALIHEKLYKSGDMARIDFSDYMKEMINTMFDSYGMDSRTVSLRTDIEGIVLGIDKAIPCGLIINELVSNSLKYAFPEGRTGEIHVALHQQGKASYKLMIRDNGSGIPKGVDFKSTDSLGLSLVNALVEQLQGTISLNKDKGTEFIITFS